MQTGPGQCYLSRMTAAVTARSSQIVVRMPHEVLDALRTEAARRELSVAGTLTAITATALGLGDIELARRGVRARPEKRRRKSSAR